MKQTLEQTHKAFEEKQSKFLAYMVTIYFRGDKTGSLTEYAVTARETLIGPRPMGTEI